MESDWKLYTIDELKADSKGAIAIGPFGSRLKSDNYVKSGIPVIRGTNITGGPNFKGNFVYITEEKADTLGSCNVYQNDLVFPHRGSIGEVGLLLHEKRYVLSSSLMKLTCDQEVAFPQFLYYFFKSHLGKHELLKNASQVGTPGIGQPLSSLKSIELSLPPLAEQKRIAHILGSLDDKIELNRKMNATLEAMAQALFKSWFVDFDPVIDNALRAGNPIPAPLQQRAETRRKALADSTTPNSQSPTPHSSLFPATFTHSEDLGWIPDGWEELKFGDVSQCFDRHRIPLSKKQREEKKPGAIPYYGATSVMDYVNESIFDDTYLLLGEDGSVMKEDGTPFTQYIWGESWVNNHAHVLQGAKGVSTEHLMLFVSTQNIAGFVTGAVQLKINQKNMNSIPFLYASKGINDVFSEIVHPFYDRIKKITEENQQLTKLRDTLLPKLISGELRLPEAEHLTKEALA